jgi:hypothetical protein
MCNILGKEQQPIRRSGATGQVKVGNPAIDSINKTLN